MHQHRPSSEVILFHCRPKYGWDALDDEWELVFDNGSGTYSPSAKLLNNLKDLLVFNFPGLNIVTYDYNDLKLKESVQLTRVYIKKIRSFFFFFFFFQIKIKRSVWAQKGTRRTSKIVV